MHHDAHLEVRNDASAGQWDRRRRLAGGPIHVYYIVVITSCHCRVRVATRAAGAPYPRAAVAVTIACHLGRDLHHMATDERREKSVHHNHACIVRCDDERPTSRSARRAESRVATFAGVARLAGVLHAHVHVHVVPGAAAPASSSYAVSLQCMAAAVGFLQSQALRVSGYRR